MTHCNSFLISAEVSLCTDRVLLKIPVSVILPQLVEALQTFKLVVGTIEVGAVQWY